MKILILGLLISFNAVAAFDMYSVSETFKLSGNEKCQDFASDLAQFVSKAPSNMLYRHGVACKRVDDQEVEAHVRMMAMVDRTQRVSELEKFVRANNGIKIAGHPIYFRRVVELSGVSVFFHLYRGYNTIEYYELDLPKLKFASDQEYSVFYEKTRRMIYNVRDGSLLAYLEENLGKDKRESATRLLKAANHISAFTRTSKIKVEGSDTLREEAFKSFSFYDCTGLSGKRCLQ